MPRDVVEETKLLVDVMKRKFAPPEYVPGCEVVDVTDIDLYGTNNGWIEVLTGKDNQQRVRYKGDPPDPDGKFIDVVHFPSVHLFEVWGQGGTANIAPAGLWQYVGGTGPAIYYDQGNVSVIGNRFSVTSQMDGDNPGPQIRVGWEEPAYSGIMGFPGSQSMATMSGAEYDETTYIARASGFTMTTHNEDGTIRMYAAVDLSDEEEFVPTELFRAYLRTDGAKKFGFGTTAAPHSSVGDAMIAIEGSNASSALGPHVQITTASDDYPLFQALMWDHDNLGISFDGYHDDGSWLSSDAGSNFQIFKIGDQLKIGSDFGISQGGTITWDYGVVLGATELVLNDSKRDLDLRVRSNTRDDAFFVQGSDGFVGLGIDAPLVPLQLVDSHSSSTARGAFNASQTWSPSTTSGSVFPVVFTLQPFYDTTHTPAGGFVSGVRVFAENTNSGVLPWRLADFFFTNAGSGTIATSEYFVARAPANTGGGAITTYTAFRALASTTATTNRGFIQEGSGMINEMAGDLTVGSPTGGHKGTGTINVSGNVYKNNVAYTSPDYALEHWVTGAIEKYKDNQGAKEYLD